MLHVKQLVCILIVCQMPCWGIRNNLDLAFYYNKLEVDLNNMLLNFVRGFRWGMVFVLYLVSAGCEIPLGDAVEQLVNEDGSPTAEARVPGLLKFSDGFELGNSGNSQDIYRTNGSRWTTPQIANASQQTSNEVVPTNTIAKAGDYSLEILAYATLQADTISRAAIQKDGLRAYASDRITIEAYYFIEGHSPLQGVTLLDLECSSCWDPKVPNNHQPGIRILVTEGNVPVIERGKIGFGYQYLQGGVEQAPRPLPHQQWFKLTLVLDLSPLEEGRAQLWIDDEQAIDARGINMPSQKIFEEIYSQQSIDFELSQPVFYEFLQVGATTNESGNLVHMYMDEVSFVVESGAAGDLGTIIGLTEVTE